MTQPRDRRRASALQDALERYEGMLADGTAPHEARDAAAKPLTSADARSFAMAAGLRARGERFAAAPDPAFVASLSARLRAGESLPSNVIALRPRRMSLVPLAAAACIAFMAALLVPAFNSLPGDALYGLKGASEDARVLFASGAAEADVRLDLAGERFDEVEGLINRARVPLPAALPGTSGLYAAGAPVAGVITDPELAALIESTLAEGGRQLEAAADIITNTKAASTKQDIDELITVTRRGHALAASLAEELPDNEQPPVLNTVVKLAKIQAAAKAARTNAPDENADAKTPPPCATPRPSGRPTPTPRISGGPTATPEQQSTAGQEPSTDELTPPPTEPATTTAVESPDATPDPQATPCTTPKPTPRLSEGPVPTPTDEPTDAPSVEQGVDDGTDGDSGNDDAEPASDVSGSGDGSEAATA